MSLNSPCADQLQRCGLLIEEFERQLHDLKNNAFRSCFPKSCVHEKVAFDECFAKSLQAVRGPLLDNPLLVQNDFFSAAEDFQSEVQQCFDNGGISLSEEPPEVNVTARDTSQLLGAVFSTELADQLWGLPNGEFDRKSKEITTQNVCNSKDGNNRVFGGGISRIAPQKMAADQLNNLTATCTLNVSELACFKRALDYDPQYRSLISTKERTLHSCIQNTRLQSEANCQIFASTKMRSCICNARQVVDSRIQSILLDCVQNSPVAQLYAALVSLSFGGSPLQQQTTSPTRLKPITGTTHFPPLPETSFQNEELMSLPSDGAIITQGSIVNGQCLCACPQKCVEPLSSKLIAIQSNSDFTSNQKLKTRFPATSSPVLSPITQQNIIGYNSLSSMPWYFQPVQTALSAEAGIANGFERFFNGQPPLKRK